ncbi:Na+/H+ antiporter NhaA [Flavobacterium sp. W21_SRS_FM6]|uniref:Na+/H+ antiporter NhaA n=1 Tax=Flavobacterium sp. W21_SRS_FM6 TaxID=3240268 RepID=UPI003F8D9776
MGHSITALFKHEAAGGVILVAAALFALIIANSPAFGLYQMVFDMPVTISIGAFCIDKPMLLWINDGLMAIFFFLIGLEVKREVLDGHLSSPQKVALPAIAAIAGIMVPALFYAAFNYHDAVTFKGWAVPAATDIAFALGVFSLFGRALPITLKLFLLSVAIFDDIGAIIIIALFYSADMSLLSLSVGLAGLCILFLLNRFNVAKPAAYLVVGVVVWAAVLKSGVHATLAGFAIAWFIPLKPTFDGSTQSSSSMLLKLEEGLHTWVAFLILPVFAFANAGVRFIDADVILLPVVIGIIAGLFVGKQLGIFGACWLAVKLGVAKLPAGVTWLQVYAVSILCGIGFTMSLFVGSLAFEGYSSEYLDSVKIGVLSASLLSACFGAVIISLARKKQEQ